MTRLLGLEQPADPGHGLRRSHAEGLVQRHPAVDGLAATLHFLGSRSRATSGRCRSSSIREA